MTKRIGFCRPRFKGGLSVFSSLLYRLYRGSGESRGLLGVAKKARQAPLNIFQRADLPCLFHIVNTDLLWETRPPQVFLLLEVGSPLDHFLVVFLLDLTKEKIYTTIKHLLKLFINLRFRYIVL